MIRVQNNPLKWTLSIYCSFSFSLFFHFDPHFEILYHKVNFVFTFHFFSIKWHGFKPFSVQKKISDCLKKKTNIFIKDFLSETNKWQKDFSCLNSRSAFSIWKKEKKMSNFDWIWITKPLSIWTSNTASECKKSNK